MRSPTCVVSRRLRPLSVSLARLGSLLGIAAALATGTARAADWDPAGDQLNVGGSGTWDLSSLFWNDDFLPPNVAWPNTATSAAVFGGAGGTITINTDGGALTGVGVTANSLTFNADGYTIAAGDAAELLTLGGATPTVAVTNALQTAAISANIAGTAGLIKDGVGVLVLSGTNTFSGTVAVNGGILSVGADANLGAAANGITLQAGTTLNATGSFTANRVLTLAGAATVDVATASTLTLTPAITANANALLKTGSGTLQLTAASTRTGGTVVQGGNLTLLNVTAAGSGDFVVQGGTLQSAHNAAGQNFPANVQLDGGTFIHNPGANQTLNFAAGKGINIASGGGTIDVSPGAGATSKIFLTAGQLSGAGTLTKTGPGVVQIGGAHTGFSGSVNINGGTLEFQNVDALGTGTTLITIGSGGDFATSGVAVRHNFTLQNGGIISANTNANGDYQGTINVAGNATAALRLFQTTATAQSFKISGPITGAGNLTATAPAAAVLTLTGSRVGHSGQVIAGPNATVLYSNAATINTASGLGVAGGTAQIRTINSAVESVGLPGLNATYYNTGLNANATVNPAQYATDYLYASPRAFTRIDPNINVPIVTTGTGEFPVIPVPGFATGTTVGGQNDAIMWKGLINITNAATYQFLSATDDNDILFIDGVQVGSHAAHTAGQSTALGSIFLSAGAHSIVYKMSNGATGGYSILSYNGGAGSDAPSTMVVPSSAFTTGSLAPVDLGPITSTGGTIDIASPAASASLTLGAGTLTLNSPTIDNLTIGGALITGATPTLAPNTAGLIVAGAIGEDTAGRGLNFAGPYFAEFQASNSYTGTTTVTGGQLRLNAASGDAIAGNLTINAPNANGAVENVQLLQPGQIADTATLTMTAGVLALGGNNETVADLSMNGGTITGSGTLTVSNAPTLTAGTISANLAGTFTLNKTGTGTAVLAGPNTYVGVTNVTSGILVAQGASPLGAGGAGNGTTVSSGASLRTGGANAITEDLTISGTGLASDPIDGALRNVGGVTQIRNLSTGAAATVRVDSGEVVINGALNVGGGALTKTGNGTLTFAGNQAVFPSVTHLGGAIGFTGTQSFGAAVVPAGLAYQFNSNPLAGGGSVNITAGATSSVIANFAADQAFLSALAPASTGTLALAVDNANNLNFSSAANVSLGAVGLVNYSGALTPNAGGFRLGGGSGKLSVNSVLAGTAPLEINGDLQLNGLNTFTGTTTIKSGGRLSYINDNALGTVTNTVVLDGGILQLNNTSDQTGATGTWTSLGWVGNSGGRVVSVGAGGGTLDLPARQGQGTFAVFNGTNTLTGSGALTKTGLGFLGIMSSNNYSGALTIANSGNRVDLRAGGALPNISSVTINVQGRLDVDNNSTLGSARVLASVDNRNRFNDAATITLNGGTLRFVSRNVAFAAGAPATSQENFGATTLGIGTSVINSTRTGGGGADMVIANLVRPYGSGLVTFASDNNTLGQSGDNARIILTQLNGVAPTFNSMIGGWATIGSADFAAYGANATVGGAAGTATGVTNYGSTGAPAYTALATTTTPGANGWATGIVGNIANVDVALGQAGAGQNFSIGGLKISGAATRAITFLGTTGTPDTLYVESGGIISENVNNARSIGATTNAFTRGRLTAGSLTATTPQELFFHMNQNTLTVNSQIIDNPNNAAATVKVVKAQDGTVTLDGANLYSGGTLVARGTLAVNSTGGLGSGAVLVKNAQLNLGNKGSTSSISGVTVTDQGTLVLTNGTAGAAGQYNADGDRFSLEAGSTIYANSPGAGFGFNSLTRVTSLTAGGQIVLAPGAIVKHNVTNAANQGAGTLTIQNLGTAADLFFAPVTATNGAAFNQTVTVGAGTPWAGLSSDRGNIIWNAGTIYANSDFTLQGLTRDGAISSLTLGENTTSGSTGNKSGGVQIVNNASGPISARVIGQVILNEDEPVTMPSNLTFVLTPGSVFQPNMSRSLGYGSSQAKVLVQSGGMLDPGNFTALGAAANQTLNPDGTLNGFQNLPYPVPSPVNGLVTVEAGGRFVINDGSGIGSAPAGSYTLKTNSVLELGTANAFFGRGTYALNLAGPVDTTGLAVPGQFVYESGTVVRLNADNVYKISQFTPTDGAYVVFGASRTYSNQTNPFLIPTVGTPIFAPEDLTLTSGGVLTNDASDRTLNDGRGRLLLGNGSVLAATSGTFFSITEGWNASAGANISIGTARYIDGLAKLGALQLNGANSNTAGAGASFTVADGAQLSFGAVNVFPDSTPIHLTGAVTAYPGTGGSAVQPATGSTLLLNTTNFMEHIGALTGNGTVMANQTNTALAVGRGAASDFTSNVVFKNTNGQNPSLVKTGSTKLTLTGTSDSTGDIVAQEGELIISGTGIVDFNQVRPQKGARITIDNTASAVNNRLGNPSFLIPTGGVFQLIGNGSTAVSEAIGTMANGAGNFINTAQNGQLTKINIVPGAATTTLAVGTLENFQSGTGQRVSGFVISSPSMANQPGTNAINAVYTANPANTLNGLVTVTTPNLLSNLGFGIGNGGTILTAPGTSVVPTRPDILWDTNPNGDGQGFTTIDGVLRAGTIVSLTNTMTVNSADRFTVGQTITGTAIPAGTTITGITGNVLTLSNNATGAANTVNATLYNFADPAYNYIRPLADSEYASYLRDNQSVSVNTKLSGTTTISGDTRVQTLTLTPGSTLNISGTLPLGTSGSRLHLNGAGVFVQAGAASSITGTTNTFLQANGGAGLFLHTRGDLNVSTSLYSDLGIIKTGEGTLNLAAGAINAFRTTFQVDGGTVNFAPGNQFGNVRAQSTFGAPNLYLNSGTLNLNGNSQMIGLLNNSNELPGMGGVITSATPATLTVNSGGRFSGAITGAMSLFKPGNNTLLLTNDSPYTGTTKISAGTLTLRDSAKIGSTSAVEVNYGTLQFDNGYLSNVSNRVNPAAPVTLRGGTVNLTGAAGQVSSQTFASVTLAEGLNNFTSNAGGSGANEIFIGNLQRTVASGATVNFQQNFGFVGTAGNTTAAIRNFVTNVNGSAPVLNDGILGGWAIVNGDHFATYRSATGIGAYGNTADGFANYESTDATTATPTQNVNDGTARTFTSSKTINSWRIVPNAAVAMTLNSGVGLTIDSGGLLINNNNTTALNAASGAFDNSITSNSGELVTFVNQNTASINIPITGSINFVKSGGGSLNLRPEAAYPGTVTSGSDSVTMPSTAGLVVGQPVSGTGIQANTTISAVTPTSITLSKPANAGASTLNVGFGNSYGGTTFSHGGTLTLNMGGSAAGYYAIPGNLVINASTVTEANVVNQIVPTANITIGGGGRLNLLAAGGVSETLGSVTFLDGAGGTALASGLDRGTPQPTSLINLSGANAITSTNTNPSTGVPFIGGNTGLLGFTSPTGATLNVNSPVGATGLAAVGLRIDATIAGVPTGIVDGGLIKTGPGLLVLNPTAVTTPTSTFSVTTTNANNVFTGLASTAGLVIGQPVTGTGIAAGTVITHILDGTSVRVSTNATASGTVTATYGGAGMNQFGNPTGYDGTLGTLVDVFNIQQGVVRIDQSAALGNNVATTVVQNGAVLLGSNTANLFVTGSVRLNGGSTLGATINQFSFGIPTTTVAGQSVLNVPSGTVNIAAYDYFHPGTNNGNIFINGRLTGSGTINIVGSQITQGNGGGGLIQLSNPITTGLGANDFAGLIKVGTNAILQSMQYQLDGATSSTGNELGAATVELSGGRLRIRDDFSTNNSNVSNQTAAYGNNVNLTADSYLDANRSVGTGVNNTIAMGKLSVAAGTKVLNVDSSNGYVVRFSQLDGPGALIKGGAGLLTIDDYAPGYTGSFGFAGPQGNVVAATFNTTSSANVTFTPAVNAFQTFAMNGFYITPANKTFDIAAEFSVQSNPGNVSGMLGVTGGGNATTINTALFRNDGQVGAVGGAATITANSGFTGSGVYVTRANPLNLAGNFVSGTMKVAGDSTVSSSGTGHVFTNGAEVQSGTFQMSPSGVASTSGNIRVIGSPVSAASASAAAIDAVNGTFAFDASQGSITHTGNITNSGTVRAANGTTTINGTISGPTVGYVPGLLEGFTTAPGGSMNVTTGRTPNPGNFGIRLEPRMLQTNAVTQQALTGHIDNDTWIYTGYVKDDDGVFSFAENIDDRAAVWIDGTLVLNASNGGTSRVVSTAYSVGQQGTVGIPGANLGTPSQNFGPGIPLPGYGTGWHLIEIRMNNGTGGSGPISGNGFGVNYGFGYKNGIAALDGADMIKPIDNGSGNLFVTPINAKGNVEIAGNATLNVGGVQNVANLRFTGQDGRINLTTPGFASAVDRLDVQNPALLNVATTSSLTVGELALGTNTLLVNNPLTQVNGTAPTGQFNVTGTGTGTGTLDFNGGVLNVTGSISGSVILGDGVLAGNSTSLTTGVIGGVAELLGGQVSPNLNAPGSLRFNGGANLVGSGLHVNLNGLTAGTEYDQLIVTGQVSVGASVPLTIGLGFLPEIGDKFTLIANDGAEPIDLNALFIFDNIELTEGDHLFLAPYHDFTISYAGGDGNDIELTYFVPEPGSATLMLGGLAAMCARRRRKSR